MRTKSRPLRSQRNCDILTGGGKTSNGRLAKKAPLGQKSPFAQGDLILQNLSTLRPKNRDINFDR
jgi:hypothetical protein